MRSPSSAAAPRHSSSASTAEVDQLGRRQAQQGRRRAETEPHTDDGRARRQHLDAAERSAARRSEAARRSRTTARPRRAGSCDARAPPRPALRIGPTRSPHGARRPPPACARGSSARSRPTWSHAPRPSLIASPPRSRRPVARRRSRASSAPTPAASITTRRVELPAGRPRAPRAPPPRCSRSPVTQHAHRAAAQLGVRDPHAAHQRADRAPAPHHQRRRERVEDDLLGGARLQPRRARHDLVARPAPRSRCRRARPAASPRRHVTARGRARRRRPPPRPRRPRTASSRSPTPRPPCRPPTAPARASRPRRPRRRPPTASSSYEPGLEPLAGQQRDHGVVGHAVGRAPLAGVHRGEAAARAGAHVDHPRCGPHGGRSTSSAIRGLGRPHRRQHLVVALDDRVHDSVISSSACRTAPPTRAAGSLPASALMCAQASQPHVHRSSIPAARAAATAARMSSASPGSIRKPWIHSCAVDAVLGAQRGDPLARTRARTARPARRTPSSTGRCTSVSSPGSAATRPQSEMPCTPPVSGSRQHDRARAPRGDVVHEVAR